MTGDHVVHEFFRDTAQAAWDTWKSARRWKKALWIFLMLVMSPFIIEGGVLLFLLGIFMPIGFFFGLLEHHLPFLWGAYVCIVNIGGLGDLVADVTMLGDVLSIMFEVFKLCCLAIDIAGITHLFYWVILDLQRWCRPTEYLEIAHGEEHTETA
eukprot:TRINITY_DN9537_c0_g1_i2.p1 TRINITY_DN9537_c0_g1~~TRINITY_DN9537_c0_g1_i2.p1  ORF type:complete len:154 (+),score=19.46 TRINITY_DN9537_c0_g1_i2:92-553(+)